MSLEGSVVLEPLVAAIAIGHLVVVVEKKSGNGTIGVGIHLRLVTVFQSRINGISFITVFELSAGKVLIYKSVPGASTVYAVLTMGCESA